jgi:HD domain-containing protein
MLRPCLAPEPDAFASPSSCLDGSGYPRGIAGSAIPAAARVLGAADVYQAMIEPRPHRPARAPDDAARQLAAEARAGLTGREVEVLRLLAQGALPDGELGIVPGLEHRLSDSAIEMTIQFLARRGDAERGRRR